MWAIDVLLSNYFNSSSNKSDLFTTMFPDRAIAKGVTCGATKCGYILCFDVAPYMKAILDDISSLDTYVVLFDESFNKSAKKGQMNLHVRFELLGKASAHDLYEKFISCLSEIEPNKLLHVSSDGTNVNLAFLDILNRFRQDNEQPHLVNVAHADFILFIMRLRMVKKPLVVIPTNVLAPYTKFLMNLLRVEQNMKS